MHIPNPTLQQFISWPPNGAERHLVEAAIEYADFDATDTMSIGPIQDRTFGEVKDLQHTLSKWASVQDWADGLKVLAGYTDGQLAQVRIFALLEARAFVLSEVLRINEAEATIVWPEDEASKMAGFEWLAMFGSYTQIRQLAGGDVLRIDAVRTLPYTLCFLELKYLAESALFEKRRHDANLLISRRQSRQ